MNRNILIAAIVVLAIAGVYLKTHGTKVATEAPAAATVTTTAPAASSNTAATAPAATATAAATTAAATTAAATTAAATMADAATVLDPAHFDAAKVTALIEASALDDATKTSLKTQVTAAAADSTKVADAVAQVKKALGM